MAGYLFFGGCKIPYHLDRYGTASKRVLQALGIELFELDFNCCGYPIRHQSQEASFLSAARNLALAGKQGLHLVTPCKCCYGNFRHAVYWINQNEELRRFIVAKLAKEGLSWEADIRVKHILQVLREDVGLESIRRRIKHPQSGLRLAAHYGCHALRPADVVQFDNPFAPTLFEELIGVTGARSVAWTRRLDCCGNPLWEKNNALSLMMLEKKLVSAADAGADQICTACTYCQLQFEFVGATVGLKATVPAVLYPEVLGKALGMNL